MAAKTILYVLGTLLLLGLVESTNATVTVDTLPTPDTTYTVNQLIGGVFQPLNDGTLANFTVHESATGTTCYAYWNNGTLIKSVSRNGTTCIMNVSWNAANNYTLAIGTPATSSTHVYKVGRVTLPITYTGVKYLCKAYKTPSGGWDTSACGLIYHYNIVAITSIAADPVNDSTNDTVVNILPTPDALYNTTQYIGGVFQPLENGTLKSFTVDSNVTGTTCFMLWPNRTLITSVTRSGTLCPINVTWSTNYNYTLAVGTPNLSCTHAYKSSTIQLPINYTSVQYLCKAYTTDGGVNWDTSACNSIYHYNIVAITTTTESPPPANMTTVVTTLPTPDTTISFNQLLGGIFQPLANGTLANFTVDANVTGTTCYVFGTVNNSLLTSVVRSGTNCPVNIAWSTDYNYTLAVGTPGESSQHAYLSTQTPLPESYAAIKYWCKAGSDNDGSNWTLNVCGYVNHYNIVAITTIVPADYNASTNISGVVVNILPMTDSNWSVSQIIGGIYQPLTNGTLANFTVDVGVTGTTCYVYGTSNNTLLTSLARSGTNCPMNMSWSTNYNYTLAVGTPSSESNHRYRAEEIALPATYTSVKYWCKTTSENNGTNWGNTCGLAYHYNIIAITTTP